MPVFILLIFGVVEFSGVIMTKSGTSNATQAAARTASVQGNNALADREILLRLRSEAAGLPHGEIQQIVIWHASGPNDSVPVACSAEGSSGVTDSTDPDAVGNCNVYNNPEAAGGAFQFASDPQYKRYFGCPVVPDDGYNYQRLDCNWPAQKRKVAQGLPGTNAGNAGVVPDYVGIYIRAEHQYYTGMFGKSVVVEETGIGRIEPQKFVTTP